MMEAVTPTKEATILLTKIRCELEKAIVLIGLAEEVVKNIVDGNESGDDLHSETQMGTKEGRQTPKPRSERRGIRRNLGGSKGVTKN